MLKALERFIFRQGTFLFPSSFFWLLVYSLFFFGKQ